MALLNYTTKIAAETSLSEIMGMLALGGRREGVHDQPSVDASGRHGAPAGVGRMSTSPTPSNRYIIYRRQARCVSIAA
jgi:hypothetical protein